MAILLATFNGERFLCDQLDSIGRQTFTNWVVYVSDDGSSDGTLAILQRYSKLWGGGKLFILQGLQKGLCTNFLSLVANPNIQADFYALCDQDDVWLPSKLQTALDALQPLDQSLPMLYCSRTRNVNEQLADVGLSPLFTQAPGFGNALVQSIAGGNTMVFNQTCKLLISQVGVVEVVVHDWWIYILVTAAQGRVLYDAQPHILYRQHQASIIGAANSWRHKLVRVWHVAKGLHKQFAARHIQALELARPLISAHHLPAFEAFKLLHKSTSVLSRWRFYKQAGLYRQTLTGQWSLVFSVLFGRL